MLAPGAAPAACPCPLPALTLVPDPCPPRGVFAAGGADERCPGCAACGLVNSCFVFLWFPLALSEDSVCGLIRAGLAASSSAEAPAASPPARGSLLALGEAFPRSQLLSPAAAGCFGGGCEMPPMLLSSVATEMKTKPCQSPAPCCWPHPKSPTIPKRVPATTTLAPDPLQLLPPPRFCPPPAWGPRFCIFFSSPFLLPRPSLCDCATRRIVFAKPWDLSLALGSVLFLPSKREKGIAAELSPAPGPCCCRTTQRDRLRGTFGASGTICKQPSSPKTRPSLQQGGRALHRVTPRDMKTLEEPPCFPGTSQPGCSSAPARCLLPTSGQPQPLRERRKGKGCPKRGQNKEGVER